MKKTRDLFRDNLRAIISDRGLKLEKAAEKIGISLSFLNQLLSGKSSYSPESLDKICDALNCSAADLFRTEGERLPSASGKLELLGGISLLLPTLNEDQLGNILTLVSGYSSGKAVDRADTDAI